MSLVDIPGGYYKDGTWVRTKFCFMYCGPENCNCMPPNFREFTMNEIEKIKVPFPFLPHQLAWIEDLKTTTEPQTRINLFRKVTEENAKRGFCCLGRICVLEGIEDQSPLETVAVFDGSSTQLPDEIVTKYKMRGTLGGFKKAVTTEKNTYADLADMNDSGEWTFKQIAEYIEQNPENVFTNLD